MMLHHIDDYIFFYIFESEGGEIDGCIHRSEKNIFFSL
jgi:hypothetical protein